MAEATLRETLSATMDQATTPPTPAEPAAPSAPVAPSTPPASPAPTTPGAPSPPGGAAAPALPSETPPPYLAKQPPTPTAPPAAKPPVAGTPPTAPAGAPPAPAPIKVPQSWPVHIRDKWAGLPPEVQAQVHRREQEVVRTLQESTEARKHMEEFRKINDPYRHLIDMEGADPMKAYGDYLRTAAVLRQGQPQMKAHMLADIVQRYGVDVNMLDAYLSQMLRGGQVQGPAAPVQSQDPRVDQMYNYLNQQRQAQEQYSNQRADRDLQAFEADASNEFFNDVKIEMADLLDYNAERGVVMTLKEAYDAACAMNPSIRQTLSQRQIASLGTPPDQLAAARAAASSIAPLGGGNRAPAPSEPTSVRGALEATIQKLSGGNRM